MYNQTVGKEGWGSVGTLPWEIWLLIFLSQKFLHVLASRILVVAMLYMQITYNFNTHSSYIQEVSVAVPLLKLDA